jgi:ribosomal protein S18 acetylase RimI-like enzyme
VKYKAKFYDSIVINQIKSEDKSVPPVPLFTCAAIIQSSRHSKLSTTGGDSLDSLFVNSLPPPPSSSMIMCREEEEEEQQRQQKRDWQSSDQFILRKKPLDLIYNKNNILNTLATNNNNNRNKSSNSDDMGVKIGMEPLEISPKQKRTEQIIGCIVGSFNTLDKLDASLSTLLIENPTHHSRVFYIMTLGTAVEYRHLGIGTTLVERAVSHAQQDERCGAVYLHVITYNQAAISFYEKLGFVFGK